MSSDKKVLNVPLPPVEYWFHYERGFYFVRRTDGSVSIEQYILPHTPKIGEVTRDDPHPVWRLHLSVDAWVSIIGLMSATHKEELDLPYQFHMGTKYKKDVTL